MTKVLGIRIDQLSKEEALLRIEEFLKSDGLHLVFTPNPEMVVKAENDPGFKEILNSSSLNICDGFGLYVASKLKYQKVERIAGVDFMTDICALAEKEGRSVFLLGSGRDEVLIRVKENLLQRLPKLKIAGLHKGPSIIESPNAFEVSEDNEKIIQEINSNSPDIIFVAFGMGKQEKWLKEFGSRLSSVKIGMGVGGAFDYVSGLTPRSPLLMRKFGLEWAYRLFKQPYRFKRILNATISFEILFLRELFRSGLKN